MSPLERLVLRIRHRESRHAERRFRLVTEARVAPVRKAYTEQVVADGWDENMLASAWGR